MTIPSSEILLFYLEIAFWEHLLTFDSFLLFFAMPLSDNFASTKKQLI